MTATTSSIIGTSPSMFGSPRTSSSSASKSATEMATFGAGVSSLLSNRTISSTWPRRRKIWLVRLRSTVSPVVKAAEMMRVLSIRPTMISTVCAIRRGMLRTPMRNMIRLRRAM